MDQPKNPIPKTEAETKACEDEVKIETEKSSAATEEVRVDDPVGSIVKPLVEEVSKVAKSLIENVDVTQLEKGVENLVSDPWTSLKSLGVSLPSSSPKDDVLPTSDKTVGESSETARSVSDETIADCKQPEKGDDIDENPRSTHTQPFVAVAAGPNASWMNCCGLLDVLRRSDH